MPRTTQCPTRFHILTTLLALSWLMRADSRAASSETFNLEYRFHRGEIVGYSVDSQSKVFLQQQEAEQHVEHGSFTNKRFTVKSVDADGNAVLDLQIDRVRLNASVDGGDSVTYDTDSGEEPPNEFQGISATVGKPHARVKVSPRGELLSLDWLIASDQAAKPTVDDAASLDILMILPESPVQIGETWKQQFEVDVNATPTLKKSIKIQREYTLKKVEGQQATISLKTVVLTPLHDAAQESQLVNRLRNGTILFDLGRGAVVSRSLEIDKVVVGFSGPDSKVHTISSQVEKLAPVVIAAEQERTKQ